MFGYCRSLFSTRLILKIASLLDSLVIHYLLHQICYWAALWLQTEEGPVPASAPTQQVLISEAVNKLHSHFFSKVFARTFLGERFCNREFFISLSLLKGEELSTNMLLDFLLVDLFSPRGSYCHFLETWAFIEVFADDIWDPFWTLLLISSLG